MACPTCDHTMQNVGDNGGRTVFWCPRCGGLKTRSAVPEFEPPTNNHLWPITNIKAVPELLKSCKALLDTHAPCEHHDCADCRKAFHDASAAIANAIGKAVPA